MGRSRIGGILPSFDPSFIRHELLLVSEMKELLIAEGGIPIEGTRNITSAVRRISVENQVLSIQELLEVGSTLRTSHLVHAFLTKRKTQYPNLAVFLEFLIVDKVLEFNITQSIDEQGFIRDSASKELRQIRRDLVAASNALRDRLDAILRKVSAQDLVQDEILTTRDGRMVIPVKVEHKTHVAGFIHSTSASGQTVYIEPAETLDLNNALRELQLAEQREMHKILSDLTNQVREVRDPLDASLLALVDLDVLAAKAKYSIEIVGNPVALSEQPVIKLVQARHPVLLQRHPRDQVVPLDLALGGETSTLLITGPNAGGKTVALKTVGLLSICTMAGIHVPAASESIVFPFRQIFVDIGDDQSIESDLSSFSSHLINMKDTLAQVDGRSLALIDEIGAGTDPAEGAALAAAFLAVLQRHHAVTIATTHDGFLKAFAHETPGMENASMEFNHETLRPTYRFRFGVPGSSFAFELAERIGVPKDILDAARTHVGIEKHKLETLILDLEQQAQTLKFQLTATEQEHDRLSRRASEYESQTAQLKREIADVKRKAVVEARDIVRSAKATIEQAIKEIRESGAQPDVVRARRQDLQNLTQELLRREPTPIEQSNPPETVAIGDHVRLVDGSQVGEVIQIQKDLAVVAWGHTTMRVQVRNLVKLQHDPVSAYQMPRADLPHIDAKNEIDLRGLLGDDAIQQVQLFLDNAFVSGLHRVDIIHGKGTGALRKRVTEFLKSCPHVKSYRLGEWNEGGTGVTVVELS